MQPKEELKTKLRQIAAELNASFVEDDRGGMIDLGKFLKFRGFMSWNSKGMITFIGVPEANEQAYQTPSINCNINRPAKDIARDIKRRLLEDVRVWSAEHLASATKRNREKIEQEALLESLLNDNGTTLDKAKKKGYSGRLCGHGVTLEENMFRSYLNRSIFLAKVECSEYAMRQILRILKEDYLMRHG